MRHRARVLADAIPDNAGHCVARVEVAAMSACQRCAANRGCGAGLFSHGAKPVQLTCSSSRPLARDQQVTVEFDDADAGWLLLVAGAYGLPLLGLMLSTILASLVMAADEWVVALAALAGLAGGVIAWRKVESDIVARVEKGLCVQSGRIVADSRSFQPPEISNEN